MPGPERRQKIMDILRQDSKVYVSQIKKRLQIAFVAPISYTKESNFMGAHHFKLITVAFFIIFMLFLFG